MVDIPPLDRKGYRNFGLMFGGIVGGLFGIVFPWVFEFSYPSWPWIILAVFTCWSLVAPESLSVFYQLWMRFGLILNAIMSRIILGVVFYIVVLPIGLFVRLGGRDPMNRKLDDRVKSYRKSSEKTDVSRMEKPF